jgi:hypothetical protein
MITHIYKYIRIHTTPMNTFKKLDQLDLKIHNVGHKEYLAINKDVTYH